MGFFFCGNIVILHFRFETRISSNNDILEQHFQTQNRSMVVAMAKSTGYSLSRQFWMGKTFIQDNELQQKGKTNNKIRNARWL